MILQFAVPGLGKRLQTKDMIVSLLGQEHPLTAKQLTQRIRKQYGSGVTFQGVYKAVQQLLEQGVLEKEGADISLSRKWIMEAKGFMDGLQQAYFEEKGVRAKGEVGERIAVYSFDNLIDLDKFWIEVFERWFDDPAKKDDRLVQLCGHAWYVFGHLENEQACLENIRKHKLTFYTLVDGDTPLDRWAAKYYTEEGFLYKTKKEGGTKLHDHYYVVYDDMILESVYPEWLAQELEAFYQETKEVKRLDLARIARILRKKAELKITVMRNRPLAEQLRKEILRHW